MRFMMMMKADRLYEAGVPPTPELIAAIGAHTEKMMKAGIVLSSGGLAPSSLGARVRATGGKLTVIDGPFTETKELIGGFAIVEANSMAEAIEMAREFIQLHRDILGDSYEGECEVRPMFEPCALATHSQKQVEELSSR